MGVCGKVCKWKWLGGMAFVWQGVGALVKIVKDAGRE